MSESVTYTKSTNAAHVKTLAWGGGSHGGLEAGVLWECAWLHFGGDKDDQYKPSILILQLIWTVHTIGLIFCYVSQLLSLLCLWLLKGEPGIEGKKVKQ